MGKQTNGNEHIFGFQPDEMEMDTYMVEEEPDEFVHTSFFCTLFWTCYCLKSGLN